MPYGIYPHYSGKQCPAWKGDKVGKKGVHDWLRRGWGRPNLCEHCLRTDRANYEWACKNHKYRRIRKDYLRLCRSCHRIYDIKYNGYVVNKSPKRPECYENTPCLVCRKKFKRLKSKGIKACSRSCGVSLGHKSRP